MRRRGVAVAGVLLLAGLLAGCAESASTGDTGFVSSTGLIDRLPADEREAPGPVEGETLQGDPVSLDDLAGKVVVLNVWGSWCAPCVKEAPLLAEVAGELEGDDVAFLGINTRDPSTDPAIAFERRFEIPYPSIYDPSGRTMLAFSGVLPPSAIPSTLVIDAEGRVAARILGEVPSARTLVQLVQDVQESGA